jgi:hypothetical protein
MAGKNKAAMGKGIVVKSPTKKESVTKSSAPKSAMPAYKSGGMTKGKKK